jgi:hypothetical protein
VPHVGCASVGFVAVSFERGNHVLGPLGVLPALWRVLGLVALGGLLARDAVRRMGLEMELLLQEELVVGLVAIVEADGVPFAHKMACLLRCITEPLRAHIAVPHQLGLHVRSTSIVSDRQGSCCSWRVHGWLSFLGGGSRLLLFFFTETFLLHFFNQCRLLQSL